MQTSTNLLACLLLAWRAMAIEIVVVQPTAPAGSTADILIENFDGAGYENSWTESGSGTRDEDYATSPAPLEGSQSLYLNASSQAPMTQFTFASNQTELWGYLLFAPTANMSSGKSFVVVYDSGGAESYKLEWESDQQLMVRINGSGATSATSGTMTVGNTYHVWFHIINGTGNATMTAGFSTDGTEPTSGTAFVSKTNGTEVDNLTKVGLGWAGNTTGGFIVDKVRLQSTGTLGSNPL